MNEKVLISQLSRYLQPGGSQKLGLTVLDELLRNEYDVAFALLNQVNLQELSTKYFGLSISKPVPTYYLFSRRLPQTTFQELCLFIPIIKAIKQEDPDVVFVDHSLYKPVERYVRRRRLIHYVHFPPIDAKLNECFPEICDVTQYQKYKRFPLNVYWHAYMVLRGFVNIEKNYADVICANSNFTAGVVKKIWDREPVVVYPPVAVNNFTPLKKENYVSSVGLIDPQKNFEELIKAVAMCETRPKLKIVGSLTPANQSYLESLQKLARSLAVDDRVDIQTNARSDVLRKTLGSSKVYVHTKHYEHFGISIVEAMASGCVAIVHRSGGPYLDIINREQYGFSYATAVELAERIDMLMNSDTCRLAKRSIERSKLFSEDRFRRKILAVIRNA